MPELITHSLQHFNYTHKISWITLDGEGERTEEEAREETGEVTEEAWGKTVTQEGEGFTSICDTKSNCSEPEYE